MADEHDDDVVRLTTAANPFQAHLWERALKEAGIRCKVVGDYLEAGLGDISGLLPEIWVHRDDLARAEKVLEATRASTPAPEDEAAEE
jgi:hypothetical protein